MAEHPATFSDGFIEHFRELLRTFCDMPTMSVVLDPFAGTGKIHQLRPEFATIGVEIEAEWAAMHEQTYEGDSTDLPGHWTAFFDAVVTSCTYGNRMADHHNAQDGSERFTYTHKLGRPLNPNNSGKMQWGDNYRQLHVLVWNEIWRVLRPGGVFILNVSDHIRKGEVVQVSEWHKETIKEIGFVLVQHDELPTRRQRKGANADLRVEFENIYTFIRNGVPYEQAE